MGIRLLETFLYKNGCCKQVNIKDLILKTGKNIIVLDLKSCFFWIMENENILYGGETKRFIEIFESFVKSFYDIKVELVAFKECIVQPGYEIKYMEKHSREMEDISAYFVRGNELKSKVLPENYDDVAAEILAKYDFKLYQNIHELDYEVAKYASENKCLCILAQDADFIFYNIEQPYLSIKHLNLKQMETLVYDKEKLAKILRLDVCDLPWIKVIMEIVDHELRKSKDTWKFHKVANFIRQAKINRQLNSSYVLHKFPTSRASRESIDSNIIEEDLNYWSLKKQEIKILKPFSDKTWNMILEKIKPLYAFDGYITGFIYSVITRSKYFSGKMLIDYQCGLKPNQLLLKKLRQKIYGILLLEKPIQKVVDEYICCCGDDTFKEPVRVVPIFPKSKHSGLLAYWTEDTKYDDEKWALFSEALEIEEKVLKSIKPHLVIPIASLHYIMKQGLKISDIELDALIASIVLPKYLSPKKLNDLPDVDLNPRAITIYTSVSKAFLTVSWLNNSIGYPISKDNASSKNYQEGKLFHFHLSELNNGATNPMENYELSDLDKKNVERPLGEMREFLRSTTGP